LGQPVIVENRGAKIAVESVLRAPPDGYVLLAGNPSLWVVPLFERASYDAVRDFSPISLTASAPLLLVVHPSVPARSVKDLIALAKARPGALNIAAATVGTSSHLAAELFKAMARVDMVYIPYKGGGPQVIGLISGETQVAFDTGASLLPHITSGRLRALAVTSAKPSALFPGLHTVAASGVPGYEAALMYGVFAPAGTPRPIINKLNTEIVRVLHRVDVKERLFNAGAEVVGSSPEALGSIVKSEMTRLGKVIKDGGLREE
jgi:tripartite-type tricarboxylate transporter receptor subunit TctC